jgi:AP-3 complex subunit beta
MLPRPVRVVKNDKEEEEMDKDVKLLLESVEPLFQSRNPAVRQCLDAIIKILSGVVGE